MDPVGARAVPLRTVGVVIPAHDEAGTIARAIRGVDAAAGQADAAVTLVVVADDCRDLTAQVAAGIRTSFLAEILVLPVSVRSPGAARAAGAEMLLRRLGIAGTWLANTDADSIVPTRWLARQLQLAASGADVVCGTVTVNDWRFWTPETRASYERSYQFPLASDGHGHIHGASLGLDASAYLAVGGFSGEVNEDVNLVTAALSAGHRVVWADDIPVSTSARPRGRASRGFSTHLHAHGSQTCTAGLMLG